MPSSPPVRLGLRVAASQGVWEVDSVRLLARILDVSPHREQVDFSEAELLELARHPDEGVVYTLLGAHMDSWSGRIQPLRRPAVVRAFLERALEDAEVEGVAWTPILDRLASGRDGWGQPRGSIGQALALGEPRLPTPEAQLRPLEAWLEGDPSPAELEEVLAFRAPAIRRQVLSQARSLTPELLVPVLRVQPSLASSLEANPHLSAELCHFLCSWAQPAYRTALAQAQERNRTLKGAPAATEDPLAQALQRLLLNLARRPSGLPAEMRERMIAEEERRSYPNQAQLKWLAQDQAAEAPQLERLALLADAEGLLLLLLHPAADFAAMRARLRNRMVYREVALQLLRNPDTPTAWVVALAQDLRHHREVLVAAVRHPESNPEVWEMALASTSSDLRQALAANVQARQHPAVRTQLLKSRSAPVLSLLLREADAGEYPGILRNLARVHAPSALRALLQGEIPPGTRIPRADLLPLFSLPGAEEREEAIRLWARLEEAERGAPTEEREARSTSSRPRR